MPYFEVQTSTRVPEEKRPALRHELARIIELIPGKSESWVMVHLEDGADMSFAGDGEAPAAMIVLKTFGELDGAQYDMLTRELCASMSERLGVPPDRLYVVYEPITHWGWNGGNF